MKPIDNNMDIKPPGLDLNQAAAQANRMQEKPGSNQVQSPNVSNVDGDSVTLTRTAEEILRLEENLANIPDIDNIRVSAIKDSIARGDYQIDTVKIVDSLINIEKGNR